VYSIHHKSYKYRNALILIILLIGFEDEGLSNCYYCQQISPQSIVLVGTRGSYVAHVN